MSTENLSTTEDPKDGPAQALSILYEANDLLNVLKEHHNETVRDSVEMSGRLAAQWTLLGAIGDRVNSAVSHLDGAVSHPADAAPAGNGEPDGDDETEELGMDRGSGSTALDDLGLIHERMDAIAYSVSDALMSGEDRDLLSLVSLIRFELRDASRICKENGKLWQKALLKQEREAAA
jgi:hypothetical protein